MLHGDDLTAHHLPPTDVIAPPSASASRRRHWTSTGRTVALDDGSTLPYDALVIATGSRVRRLGDNTCELTLRSLDDAITLRARLAHRPSVAVVGGGALGMEIASSCLAAGCPVTLVSRGWPLLHQLGLYLADVFVTAALKRGLTLVEHRSAPDSRLDGAATQVIINEGTVVEADVVVTAVGDLHKVEWLATSGLLQGGVLEVDSRGRVRLEHRRRWGTWERFPPAVASAGFRCGPALSTRARSPRRHSSGGTRLRPSTSGRTSGPSSSA